MSGGPADRGLVRVFEGDGDGREPPEQLRHRREPADRVLRHPASLRDQRAVRAAVRPRPALRRATGTASLDGVLGGWQINGIVTVQSGSPLSITASNTAGIFDPVTRPNWNGNDPVLEGRAAGTADQSGSTRASSASRRRSRSATSDATFGRLRADNVRNLDLSLFKHFALVGRARLQARVEAFNALNRVQFSGAEHERDLRLVRHRQRPGEHARASCSSA